MKKLLLSVALLVAAGLQAVQQPVVTGGNAQVQFGSVQTGSAQDVREVVPQPRPGEDHLRIKPNYNTIDGKPKNYTTYGDAQVQFSENIPTTRSNQG